jgi:hypothetical protein
MKKDELRTGMVVTLRNGEEGILLHQSASGEGFITDGYGILSVLDRYTDDLRYFSIHPFKKDSTPTARPELDIVDVSVPTELPDRKDRNPVPWMQVCCCYGEDPSPDEYAEIYTNTWFCSDHLFTDLYGALCIRFPDKKQDIMAIPGMAKIARVAQEIQRSVSDINWSRHRGTG